MANKIGVKNWQKFGMAILGLIIAVVTYYVTGQTPENKAKISDNIQNVVSEVDLQVAGFDLSDQAKEVLESKFKDVDFENLNSESETPQTTPTSKIQNQAPSLNSCKTMIEKLLEDNEQFKNWMFDNNMTKQDAEYCKKLVLSSTTQQSIQ